MIPNLREDGELYCLRLEVSRLQGEVQSARRAERVAVADREHWKTLTVRQTQVNRIVCDALRDLIAGTQTLDEIMARLEAVENGTVQ